VNVLIISRILRLYSTRRLKEEVAALGHRPIIADPFKCVMTIRDGRPALLCRGRAVPPLKAAIPRVGTTGVPYVLGVVRQLEAMGVPCANSADAIARSKNKLVCLQEFIRGGVRVPDTVVARYPRNLRKLAKEVGGTPVVLKLLHGTQGSGVVYSESLDSAESVLDTVWSLGKDILMQEFVEESRGRDLRVLVIGGKVAAAMRRFGKKGCFRSNIHRGGGGEPVKRVPPACARAALRAAKIVGLGVAGVDILESNRGPLVIEVNSSPGFQGLEKATGKNVARMIVRYAVHRKRRKKERGRRR
jgi:ribosomal protein S6--L-glutamate ligase